MATDWRERTDANIDAIRSIFESRDLGVDRKLRYCELAYHMIKDDKFDTVSAHWNAFRNALRILVNSTTDILSTEEIEARAHGVSLN